jgi:ubiquinone/menaquinone biosynthesis C-methylase UbiE
MEFSGDIGLWQRRVAECPEGAARRLAVFEALMLQAGMRVLDVGCGSGHLVQELARAVGPSGRAVGVELSDDQLNAARERCADVPFVELLHADVCDLPLEDGSLDGVSAIQTLEYVPDVDRALSEIRRVLRPGGRVAFVSVLWDAFRFHGAEAGLNQRIADAWQAHCHHAMLPAEMPGRMAAVGLDGASQRTLAFLNRALHENCLAYWAVKIVAAFAVSQGVSEEDARKWLEQLEHADKEDRFGFVSVPVLTLGTAV